MTDFAEVKLQTLRRTRGRFRGLDRPRRLGEPAPDYRADELGQLRLREAPPRRPVGPRFAQNDGVDRLERGSPRDLCRVEQAFDNDRPQGVRGFEPIQPCHSFHRARRDA